MSSQTLRHYQKFYKMAVKAGDPGGHWPLGKMYRQQAKKTWIPLSVGDESEDVQKAKAKRRALFNKAANEFRDAIKGGQEKAAYDLALMIAEEEIDALAKENVVDLIDQAAKAKEPNAMYEVGKRLYGERKMSEALKWYMDAANAGEGTAAYSLADLYDKAAIEFKKSGDESRATNAIEIASSYYFTCINLHNARKRNGNRSYEDLARTALERMAHSGNDKAAYYLGQIDEHDKKHEAKKWYQIAETLGCKDATVALDALKGQRLAKFVGYKFGDKITQRANAGEFEIEKKKKILSMYFGMEKDFREFQTGYVRALRKSGRIYEVEIDASTMGKKDNEIKAEFEEILRILAKKYKPMCADIAVRKESDSLSARFEFKDVIMRLYVGAGPGALAKQMVNSSSGSGEFEKEANKVLDGFKLNMYGENIHLKVTHVGLESMIDMEYEQSQLDASDADVL